MGTLHPSPGNPGIIIVCLGSQISAVAFLPTSYNSWIGASLGNVRTGKHPAQPPSRRVDSGRLTAAGGWSDGRTDGQTDGRRNIRPFPRSREALSYDNETRQWGRVRRAPDAGIKHFPLLEKYQ